MLFYFVQFAQLQAQCDSVVEFDAAGTTTWVVPAKVISITITAEGADGGRTVNAPGNFRGGQGATAEGTFPVTPGDILDISVGTKGQDAGDRAGGGGGSGVRNQTTGTLLIVAGGGGGAGAFGSGNGGSATTSGTDGNGTGAGTGGMNGLGGTAGLPGGAGGGGINGAGGVGFFGGKAGFGAANSGGTVPNPFGGGGTAGGGAGIDIVGALGGYGGGGGGYSGGGGGGGGATSLGGGGGGSFVDASSTTAPIFMAGAGVANETNGKITICYSFADIPVPTMGEWGLIILALFLLSFGTIAIRSKQLALNGSGMGNGFSFRHLPFDKNLYFKHLLACATLVFLGFSIAIFLFGYELNPADLPGSLIATPLLAYLFHLLKME